MTSFFQRILNPGGKSAAESGPARLTLAAFGKHPGWNDHIPGIGVETESLAYIKQAFYVTGIGGRIDAGAWKNLEAGKRLEGFDHAFLWLRAGHVILGRMHSSEDGLRRKEYPLVLCVDAEGLSIPTILTEAGPELDRLGAACRATTSSQTVSEECRMAQDRLRALLTGSGARPNAPAPGLEARRRFLEHRDLGPDRTGLLRILHELGGLSGTQSRHLRIPLAENSRTTALVLWTGFLRLAVPASVGLLIIARNGVDWLDVIIGEPDSDDFFCLQASPTALPLASQVPYELSPALKTRLRELEAKFLGPKESLPPSPPPPAAGASGLDRDVAAKAPPTKGRGWFGMLALLIVAGGVAAVWFFSGNRGSPPGDKPAALPLDSTLTRGETATNPVIGATPATTSNQVVQPQPRLPETDSGHSGAPAKVTEAQAAETARLVEEKKRAAETERKRLAAQRASLTAPEDEKQRQEAAGLAQIALASGNYQNALEHCQRYAEMSPFKELLVQIMAETNLLHRTEKFLKAGNYAAVLTNQLPENETFAQMRAMAESEQKILAEALAQFAAGDYAFLQNEAVLKLKAKPPIQKLIQAGTVEAGQLKQAEAFMADNKAEAAMNLITQHNLDKPSFAKVRQWAQTELNRLADQRRDQQQVESFFNQGDYASALNLCTKRTGLAEFDALAKRINEEQTALAGAEGKFAVGDYKGFLAGLAGKDYRTKPPFADLIRKGEAEKKLLEELERLQQAGDWAEVLRRTTPLTASVRGKKPFATLQAWAQKRYEADEELKGKDPGWLDAWLEIMLVRFNELSPSSPKLKTVQARQESPISGFLGTEAKNYYLSNVVWLRSEYEKRTWLDSARARYLKDLESTIRYRD